MSHPMKQQHPGTFYVLVTLSVVTFFATGWVVGRQSADLSPGKPATSASVPLRAVVEDDPGWDCHTQGNHVCGVPAWLSCNTIASTNQHYDYLWRTCYDNINIHHAVWRYVGTLDRHHHVWMIPGPTSVIVTRSGWAESS